MRPWRDSTPMSGPPTLRRMQMHAVPLLAGGVVQHELAQQVLEGQLARAVAAGAGLGDVVADDRLDAPLALGCVHEVVGELGGGDLRDVLVVRDGEHFLFSQLAKGKAILEGKHLQAPVLHGTTVACRGSQLLTSIKPAAHPGLAIAVKENAMPLSRREIVQLASTIAPRCIDY